MIRPVALGLVLLALCAPEIAAAQDRECGDINAIVRQAYPGAVTEGERALRVGNRTLTLPSASSINPHAIVCRQWRGRPGQVLVAVPLIAQVRPDSTSGDLDVLVVDETTGAVRQRLRLPHAMDDDAVAISGVSFDTAAYQLGPDRLAFGVRHDWSGSSRPNPFRETTLSLYEVKGATLSPILDNLVVSRSVGAWDTSCAGETALTERVLRMVPGRRGQDISVLERTTRSLSKAAKSGACVTTDRSEPPRITRLTFDGERYVVPPPLRRD